MKTTVELDASNRIVLSREVRRAAGIARRQKLMICDARAHHRARQTQSLEGCRAGHAD